MTIRAQHRAFRVLYRRGGFTIVEMLVVVVLITTLASLALSGMAVARQRARADKTKSTIRKLNEIVLPVYENYVYRRTPSPVNEQKTRNRAVDRLRKIRSLQVFEMPDSWADVLTLTGSTAVTAVLASEPFLHTAPVLRYAQTREALGSRRTDANGSGECLYMAVAHGASEPDVMEQFRTDEIGDVDADGAPEFLDGWGRPIIFLRWAAGFNSPLSPVQFANAATFPDPFDPLRVDPTGYALIPLIASGGPDRSTGYQVSSAAPVWQGWSRFRSNPSLLSVVALPISPAPGFPEATDADNITNHDLMSKR